LLQKALDAFHEARPGVRLELRVVRRPYSWAGDDRTVEQGLVRYMDSAFRAAKGYDEGPRANAEAPARRPLSEIGEAASIQFRVAEQIKWHPVDSQRAILWAARFGKQEEFVEALSTRALSVTAGPASQIRRVCIQGACVGVCDAGHFERAESVALRRTIMAAAGDVGLDAEALSAHLWSEEGVAEVWSSYGTMIRHFGITEIPVFCFNRYGSCATAQSLS
jgi:predicted DsbA family dithiol-disulfide isomerase